MGTVALARCGGRPFGTHLFSVWPGAAFAATAFPVRCAPGDNLALHVAVAQAPTGSALVVDVAGESEYGYVDEILAVAARTRGIAGIILDGCVRDIAAIAECELPVFGTGVSVREVGHDAGGSVGRRVDMEATGPVPLSVRRGDWIVADDDGVVCLPRGQVSTIIADTMSSISRSREIIDAVSAGESTLDLLGLDPSRVAGWEGAGDHSADFGGRRSRPRALNPRRDPRAGEHPAARTRRGPCSAVTDVYGGE
ncbi:RraA family protein [Nocardiopsis sp. MG754419]|uniref:RraA family protein n=1 Tax=Nocardiopsis sp. MG754419 TaxID=2259865 RepID=UPI001BAD8C48|nr:RraA family protein [Nocardiopsis sp. MG754419]MBR8741056.1 RraA family protein [Nocardiopsis sp. MG754419]